MIKRRKDKIVQEGLERTFYIVNVGRAEKEFWQLRLKDSHFVVSAVCTKEGILRCLRTICLRYKTLPRLQRALRGCEQKTGQATLDKYREEYKEKGVYMNSEVEEIVEQCRLINEDKSINSKKGIRLVNKEVLSPPVLVEKITEKVIEKELAPQLVKRKKGKVRRVSL
jgi:superfamily I DNA/RNA helicase